MGDHRVWVMMAEACRGGPGMGQDSRGLCRMAGYEGDHGGWPWIGENGAGGRL